MISKELLSEVLDVIVLDIEKKIHENSITYSYVYEYEPEHNGQINIHELAHKCKEWALSKHKYSIMIAYDVDMFRQDSLRFSVRLVTRDGVTKFKAKDIPEPEAIFKACEWILEQKV